MACHCTPFVAQLAAPVNFVVPQMGYNVPTQHGVIDIVRYHIVQL
jgi:hypothetical protein